MLKTLLNQSFADDPMNDYISTFFQCVDDLPDQQIQPPDKAHAHPILQPGPNRMFRSAWQR